VRWIVRDKVKVSSGLDVDLVEEGTLEEVMGVVESRLWALWGARLMRSRVGSKRAPNNDGTQIEGGS